MVQKMTVGVQAQAFADYRNFGGFRLALALLVFVQHAAAQIVDASWIQSLTKLEVGSVAVLAFFALSGFVIAEAVDVIYRDRPRDFLVNRILRIWPHFLVSVLMAMALGALLTRAAAPGAPPSSAFSPANGVANLFGVFPLAERLISHNFLEIAWAVRVEMAFYAMVALTIALGRFWVGPLALGKAFLIIGLAVVPAYTLALFGRGVSMFQFLPFFAFGVALYFYVVRKSPLAALVVMLCWVAMGFHVLHQAELHPVAGFRRGLVGQLVLLNTLLVGMVMLAIFPSHRFEALDRALGDLTYPFYMLHMNAVTLVAAFMGHSGVLPFAVALTLSLLASVLALRFVEPAVTRWRNRVRGRAI